VSLLEYLNVEFFFTIFVHPNSKQLFGKYEAISAIQIKNYGKQSEGVYIGV